MANQNKLKAYVRYDGTGRVIAGGPILQRFKPAVGNWVEINANECCNSIPTTTTTTTQGGGGGTPTAFIESYWLNTEDACSTTAYGDLLFYSSSSTIVEESSIFLDSALTIPVPYGYVIYISMTRYLVGEAGTLSEFQCSVQWSIKLFSSQENACAGSTFSGAFGYTASGALAPGTAVWSNPELNIPFFPMGNSFVSFVGDNTIFTIGQFSITVLTGTLTC